MTFLLFSTLEFLQSCPWGTLTLGAGGTFPAFFTDAGERLSRHHTGSPVLTRVGKTT